MKTCRVLALIVAVLIALSAAAPALAAPVPTQVSLNSIKKTVLPGGYYKLVATVKPAKAPQDVVWISSDPAVATVDATGIVMAKAEGMATITATAKDTDILGSCVLTVGNAYSGRKFRFFGIANYNYYGSENDLASPNNDLELMVKVFKRASYNGKKMQFYNRRNLTGTAIRATLNRMSTGYNIKKNDVTFFYYTGHGVGGDSFEEYRGALCGTNIGKPGASNKASLVKVDEVRKALEKVPGTVVLIIDSCLSGQFIETKGLGAKAFKPNRGDAQAFNRTWMNSFQQSTATNFEVQDKTAMPGSKKAYKFKVLAACQPLENSYLDWLIFDDKYYPFSLLTYAFWDGAVPYPKQAPTIMDADANGDMHVTLTEIFNYAKPLVQEYAQMIREEYGLDDAYQTIDIWPQDDPFPLVSIS